MNESMIAKWNEVVSLDDTIYHLGDFSMAFRSVELFTKRLNGYKILIAGNHDFVSPAHKKSRNPENKAKWIKKYLDEGWAEIHEELVVDLPGIAKVRMCHLPYTDPDPTQDQRYLKHRPIDDGRVLLCGHVHQHWRTKISSKGTLQINVGVDVWDWKPIDSNEIAKVISENIIKSDT